jgi:DNA-binding NtrC family response regulator
VQSVMVVEDDPAFARAVEAYLTRAGFEVEVARDTFAALDRVETRNFDMLVVDLARPSGKPSGLSFARMVRYRQPRSHIVFITGYPELAQVVDQLPGKVFTKPVDLEAVASEIRSQLAA